MSRSIPYIDGGELTTVLWTLGIAHPTGYPLFTLFGYAFVHIPLFSEVALRANLFAVFCTSIAGGVFYLAFREGLRVLCVSEETNSRKSTKKKQPRLDEPAFVPSKDIIIRLSSALGSLSLIFSQTFWEQSTSIEVYPLQLVLFAAILFIWLTFYEKPTKSRSFLSGLILGLGFTNHMTTVLTIPALLFLFISSYKRKKFDFSFIYWIVAGGALAGLCTFIFQSDLPNILFLIGEILTIYRDSSDIFPGNNSGAGCSAQLMFSKGSSESSSQVFTASLESQLL